MSWTVYCMTLCKHFIIGPTTFHWWAGYLSSYTDKICIKPPANLNFSNLEKKEGAIVTIIWKNSDIII